MDAWFDIDRAAAWLQQFGVWAVLISILINVLISLLGVVPTLFISGANAIVFGIVPGLLISLAGETLGLIVSFWVYRLGWSKVNRTSSARTDRWQWMQRLHSASRRQQNWMLFIARLTPLMPSGLITAVAAISTIRFTDFVFVSFVGKIPSIALETIIGHDLIRGGEQLPRLAISLIFVIIIYFIFRNKKMT
ncbi:TVP38/TMEM64 family protein [Paenibacillus sp. 481]|uniref:TVP38/TMEM64 family protein n=1 Tax=Paenibacillus sp. 481 TaxID=2835869 RepID=UPI001E4ED26A|nr:VTT domain-containing protein [Paenibacillus sp. 481]UHA73823.1 TVP38/TMEM64 family protein [Paenibacillus sp. 481]